MTADPALARWRLVLGRYAGERLNAGLDTRELRMDRALDYLYGREYRGRGLRTDGGNDKREGSLDPSQLSIPGWLDEVRELFPADVAETVETHALERYGMTELVTDPKTLERLEPSQELLGVLLSLRGKLSGEVLNLARKIIAVVVEEIKRKIGADVRRTLAGRLQRFQHSPIKLRENFDVRDTVRRNLKHFDTDRRKLAVRELRFFARNSRRLPWTVILCVDQSGSMASSVIHSAVMASILAGLPSLRVKLVVFDTAIVDLSDRVDDPVETLMSVQLGGGTDIGRALAYCESLVENPHRTAIMLISDFYEGGSTAFLLSTVKRLVEARVRLLGLAALDEKAAPVFDRVTAAELASLGMEIAALTPNRLAQWLLAAIS